MAEVMTMEQMNQQLAIPTNYGTNMSPEVKQQVDGMIKSINIHDKDKVIAYAREEQASISNFYDSMINGVGTREVGEAGEILTGVISQIQGYNATATGEEKGILGFFKKKKAELQTLQTKYKTLSVNMDAVVQQLTTKDLQLQQVSRNFETMYKNNLDMYKFLTAAIYAGEQVLEQEKEKLAVMQKEAETSGDMLKAQEVSDYNDDIIRFERRLQDLRLSRTVSMQQAPQIKTTQKSADELSESIKTTIATSIPLWKSAMAMAIGMRTVEQSLQAVNAVKDATNQMLLANSEANKRITLETAKAAERGIVDIETVTKVNQNLIDTLSGTYQIAQDAIAKRETDKQQLLASENQLKEALFKYSKLN